MYINDGLNYIDFLKKRQIVMFGAGKIGIQILKRLLLLGINVKCFLDNDLEKQGKKLEGILVYSLREYNKIKEKNDFIIVSVYNARGILEQLIFNEIYNFVDYRQLDIIVGGNSYYDEEYFGWQKTYAEIDSIIDAKFFQNYIDKEDFVAEFGSGGGFLLDKLNCKSKIGIEINPKARSFAKDAFNIESVEAANQLEDGVLDVIISSHALEHVTNPYEILCALRKKLKDKGRIVFVVPYEPITEEYSRSDVSQHLFIWNERVLGNLVKSAGFFISKTGRFGVDYPNEGSRTFNSYGEDLFKELTSIRSDVSLYYSVYVVGEKY